MTTPPRPSSSLSLKGRALRLLSQREHSRLELERKLKPYEEEPGTLTRALDELEAKDFLSEARVVQSVLHRQAARAGAARIKQVLHSKGIASDAMSDALASLQDSEHERAQALWLRRFGTPPGDAKEHARQLRFLLARGFSMPVAMAVLKQKTTA